MTRSSTRLRSRRRRRMQRRFVVCARALERRGHFRARERCRQGKLRARAPDALRAAARHSANRPSLRIESDIWGLEWRVSVHSTMKRRRPCDRGSRLGGVFRSRGDRAGGALLAAARHRALPRRDRRRGLARPSASRCASAASSAGWLRAAPADPLCATCASSIAPAARRWCCPRSTTMLAWRSLLHGRLQGAFARDRRAAAQVRRDAEGALYVAGMKLGDGDARLRPTGLLGAGRDRAARRRDRMARRAARRAAARALRAQPAPAQRRRAPLGRPVRAPAGRARRERSSCARMLAGRRARRSRGLEGAPLRRARLYRPRRLARLGRLSGRHRAGPGRAARWLRVRSGRGCGEATADLALAGRVGALRRRRFRRSSSRRLRGRLQGAALPTAATRSPARDLALGVGDGAPVAPSDFDFTWTTGERRRRRGCSARTRSSSQPLARPRRRRCRCRPSCAGCSPSSSRAAGSPTRAWNGSGALAGAGAASRRARASSTSAIEPRDDAAGLRRPQPAASRRAKRARASSSPRAKRELDLPRVFPEPRIALDFLNGLVEWERQGDAGVALRIASLTFSNAHLSGNALRHATSAAAGGAGHASTSRRSSTAPTRRSSRATCRTARCMGGEKTREWLVNGILAGQASDVRVAPAGRPARVSVRRPEPAASSSVTARVEHGVLQYAEGWPRIENIDGELAVRARAHGDRRAQRQHPRRGARQRRGRHPAAARSQRRSSR